ncbi:hypothetical protein LuPra_05178 [Luteitalea pratensis]|uniref:Uncharacterized protein n=1 Tax=Luteitalea pratensis TaxID=1855912 RepID=A0A143PVT9_LUTPR|nr:hypothetical protein LuPra_05178 [Luteitalea pratensis]
MAGSSQGRTVAWLGVLVASCIVASGEVHGQEASGTLVDSSTDRLEVSQPSRERVRPDDTRFWQAADTHGGVMAAVSDSVRLLSLQHAFRVSLSSKTRGELGGPFLKDYGSSVRMPHTWGDGDGWVINYLGHPSQGATSGWVWLQNEAGAERQTLGRSRRYWTSRGRALAWSAVYSTQFEIGPYSEASIGNVGLRPETTGWTDYVMTPVGGLAMIVAEDAIDQHLVRWLERHTNNEPLRAIYRSFMTPNRAMANVAGGRWPWHRTTRDLGERWPRKSATLSQGKGDDSIRNSP